MTNDVAVLFSFLFFVIGTSHVVCPKTWTDFFHDLQTKSYCGFIIAMYTLPGGLIILSFHNNWEWGFPVFITIMGWMMVGKSVLYFMFPDLPRKRVLKQKHLAVKLQIVGGAMMLFGALSGLSYYW